MFNYKNNKQSGLLFVEIIIVTSISVLIFGALLVSFQFALELTAVTRSKLSALSLANERMEFFRALPYNDVGTLTGIIRGPIPAVSTLTLNGVNYEERVVVSYVDGPGDGIGPADSNLLVNDYKQIKVEYQWETNGEIKELSLSSYIVPRGTETNAGGGTARIIVFDSAGQPLSGATVEISNASSTAPLFEVRQTPANGIIEFSAVPADSGYEIVVRGPIAGNDYSTAGTALVSAANTNPATPEFTITEAGISTLTFIIDQTSDLNFSAKQAIVESSQLEEFSDITGIASSSPNTPATSVTGGELTLVNNAGYEANRTVYLNSVSPTPIEQWEAIRLVADVPANTNYAIQLFTGSAATGYTLIPNSDLMNNSSGFTDTYIDLSQLDAVTYGSITVGINLTSTDSTATPSIDELELYWRESAMPLPGATFAVNGNKIIGTTAALALIYKFTDSVTTDSNGEVVLADLEFDTYDFDPVNNLDIAMACQAYPIQHQAGIDTDVEIIYVLGQDNTLRVKVQDALGRPLPSAIVQLERSGYNVSQLTDTCGQTFFTGGLANEADYELRVQSKGYTSETQTSFSVGGDTVVNITLSP